MKKFVVLSMAGILAGCQQQPEPQPVVSETPTQAAPVMVTANGSLPGTYDAVAADGTKGSTTLNANGTYKDMDATGKVTAEGAWSVKDGKTCFLPTTPSVEPMCFTETAPGPDGSFTATPDKGKPMKISPAAAQSPSDAASAT